MKVAFLSLKLWALRGELRASSASALAPRGPPRPALPPTAGRAGGRARTGPGLSKVVGIWGSKIGVGLHTWAKVSLGLLSAG